MAQTGTNQTSLVQTIDKWLEQHPALHVAYVDIARVKNSTNDWCAMALALPRCAASDHRVPCAGLVPSRSGGKA